MKGFISGKPFACAAVYDGLRASDKAPFENDSASVTRTKLPFEGLACHHNDYFRGNTLEAEAHHNRVEVYGYRNSIGPCDGWVAFTRVGELFRYPGCWGTRDARRCHPWYHPSERSMTSGEVSEHRTVGLARDLSAEVAALKIRRDGDDDAVKYVVLTPVKQLECLSSPKLPVSKCKK